MLFPLLSCIRSVFHSFIQSSIRSVFHSFIHSRRPENPPGLVEPNAWLELDDWEMPRQDVVMNRKLGSGTFGTGNGHLEADDDDNINDNDDVV